MKLRGSDVAIIGVLSAVIIVAGYIKLPYSIIGTTYQFSMGSVAMHVVAFILGPILGGITTLVGSFAGQFLTGQGGAFPMFVPATAGAIVTGLLAWGRLREGLAFFAIVICAWYMFPVGRAVWYYPYVHLIVVVLLIIVSPYMKRWLDGDGKEHFAAVAICCISGLLCDQLVGSIIAIPIFDLSAGMYKSVLFIYPVERIVLGLASAVIMVPVLKTIKRSSFFVLDKKQADKRY